MDESEIEPVLVAVVRPPGSPVRALGFRLPVPGIPDVHSDLAGGLLVAAEAPAFQSLGKDEAEATLGSLAESLTRSRYHRMRFEELLEIAKRRRTILGGPVLGDWQVVGKLAYEASAYLAAARAAIDILVYLAARRAGKTESGADDWQANDAITPKSKPGGTPITKYDVPEVLAIRARQPWFDELNHYRNVPLHRGWGEEKYCLLMPADTAPEADDPAFNAMLLPDLGCLRDRKRPHAWTYTDKRRLDNLILSLDKTFCELLEEILTDVWGCIVPPPGTIPRDEQPNTLLFLPAPVALDYPDRRRVVPVFNSKPAAKAFDKYGKQKDGLVLRAVKPTRLGKEMPGFLLPVSTEAGSSAYAVNLYGIVNGHLTLLTDLDVDPATDGPEPGVVWVRAKGDAISTLYVWQSR